MSPRAVPFALFASLFAVACGGSEETTAGTSGGGGAPPHFDYPLDDVLRMNDLQAKGTHNSYHVESDGNTLVDWHYSHVPLGEQLATEGVRAVELDTQYDEAEGVFHVYHIPGLDAGTTCELFVDCLRALKTWSDAHRAHHPLFVHVEPKSGLTADPEAYFQSYEAAIRSVWPEDRLVTPKMVQGDAASLPEALADHGFPTLGETRGRALFYFDDHAEVREAYTHGGQSLDGRLTFVDSAPSDPFAAIAVLNDPVTEADAIAEALAAGLIVRTRADADVEGALSGDTTQREAALASGAQIVTTDFPVPAGEVTYSVTIPGGTPSRCNPVTAPAECTPEAVEDPAFVGD